MKKGIMIFGAILLFLILANASFEDDQIGRYFLPYQGILTDTAGKPIKEPAQITFSMYKYPLDQKIIWEEKHNITPNPNGTFYVALGEKESFPKQFFESKSDIYLKIKITTNGKEEMLLPHQRIITAISFHHHHGMDDIVSGFLDGTRLHTDSVDASRIKTEVPASVGTSNAKGISSYLSLADHVHEGVRSLGVTNMPALKGDIALVQGVNITLTQTGQNITIASSAGAAHTQNTDTGTSNNSFEINTSGANKITLAGSSAGNPAAITATGTDANIHINLIPKGTGKIQQNGIALVPESRRVNAASGLIGGGRLDTDVDLAIDGSVIATLNTAQTFIDQKTFTARPVFNASDSGAPFTIGANSTSQKVNGLNAELWDGQRFLRGTINANGIVAAGSGFTITKNGTGDYTVSFSTAFSVAPTVTATAIGIGNIAALQALPAAGSARILTFDAAATAADVAFSFIAIGAK